MRDFAVEHAFENTGRTDQPLHAKAKAVNMAGRAAAKKKKKLKSAATASNQKTGNEPSRGKESGSRWTFLTNHSHVLVVLHNNPELVLREVALKVGITERAVQRIIQDLESEGFIERERVGRRNRYVVLADKPLRHPIESHRNIGDLLALVATHD